MLLFGCVCSNLFVNLSVDSEGRRVAAMCVMVGEERESEGGRPSQAGIE